MIIDSTYFINKLGLPQVGNPEGLIAVNNFINQYEPEFLQCVLGFDLSQAFVDGLEDSLPEQRWFDLANGKNYTYKGYNNKWQGFENTTKQSPIANYVFYQFVIFKSTDFVLTGRVVSETDNNRTVNSIDELVDAWNRMVDMNMNLLGYLRANKSLYPEWKECRCYDFRPWPFHYHSCRYNGCASNVFKKKNSFDL